MEKLGRDCHAQERSKDHREGGESHRDAGAGQAQVSIRAPVDGGCSHRDEGLRLVTKLYKLIQRCVLLRLGKGGGVK